MRDEFTRLEVGRPFPGLRPPLAEGFELRMHGGPALVLVFQGLAPQEVEAARRGQAFFGVAEEEGVLFFLFRVEGLTRGWADSPYHRALEEARSGPLRLPEPGEGERLLLTLLLVSAEDAVVRAIRLLSLGPGVSRRLLQAVRKQIVLPPDYDRRIARVYGRLSPEELARRGAAEEGGA